MKPKSGARRYTTRGTEKSRQIREAAATYGIKREVVSVREAKDQLSGLLQLAAQGTDIVITSDGQPRAMIVRYRPVLRGKPWQSLKAFREKIQRQPDSASVIDELREEQH